jgi:hypothetical protein
LAGTRPAALPNKESPHKHRRQDQDRPDHEIPSGMKRTPLAFRFPFVLLSHLYLVLAFLVVMLVMPLLVVHRFLPFNAGCLLFSV